MNYSYEDFETDDRNNGETSYGNYESPSYTEYTEEAFPGEEVSFKKKRRWGRGISIILAFAILLGVSGGTGFFLGHRFSENNGGEQPLLSVTETLVNEASSEEVVAEPLKNKTSIAKTTEDMEGVKVTHTDVSAVVEHAMPAIVSVSNDFDVVGNFFGQTYSQKEGGSGSGIIIGQNKEEILIVTNNHVSAVKKGGENQKLTVTFVDGTTAETTVKGAEVSSDLAVISVKVKDLSKETLQKIRVATLGNSDKMKVGQMVVAIGNALGYGQSTTVGYVSALNREVRGEDFTMNLLQTDAAINPGNSGGALLNTKGEVIGINTIKYASTRVEGMGFAIPITTAIPIINDLMNREVISESEQSYLGIMGQDVNESHKEIYGMPVGIYVVEVTKNSPAFKAGLKMGNIITEFNGYKIKTMKELQDRLASIKAGKTVTLVVQVNKNGEYVAEKKQVTLGHKTDLKDALKKEAEKNSSKQKKESKKDNGRKRQEGRDFFEGGRGFFGDEDDIFDFFFNP